MSNLSTRIAINGFGRIGRKVFRLWLDEVLRAPQAGPSGLEVVAINDLGSLDAAVHLLKYDSVHGNLPEKVRSTIRVETGAPGSASALWVGEHKIQVFSEKDPSKLPWGKLGVDVVHECTGIFTEKEKCLPHIHAGAKRVIISAPSKDADATLCMGVNHETYDPQKHTVVSNASCTTNCLAPVVKVLDSAFGLVKGTMMTVHAYTNDQRILDLPHKDLRRARAAALSMIPTSTGAAKAVGLVLPHLKGKLDGLSIRVPTPNVSVVDLTAEFKTPVTRESVNAALKAASEGPMKGILGFVTEPLVSIDFNGNTLSSSVDAELTLVMGEHLVKVISWYDNESGFSQRMLDLTRFMFGRA